MGYWMRARKQLVQMLKAEFEAAREEGIEHPYVSFERAAFEPISSGEVEVAGNEALEQILVSKPDGVLEQ